MQADNFNKLSQKVGVSVEDLSRFSYAAKLSDVSTEGLAQGLGFLNRSYPGNGMMLVNRRDAMNAEGFPV